MSITLAQTAIGSGSGSGSAAGWPFEEEPEAEGKWTRESGGGACARPNSPFGSEVVQSIFDDDPPAVARPRESSGSRQDSSIPYSIPEVESGGVGGVVQYVSFDIEG